MKETSETAFARISRVANGALSPPSAVMTVATWATVDWIFVTTLAAKFGITGQDDAKRFSTQFDCTFPLAPRINLP